MNGDVPTVTLEGSAATGVTVDKAHRKAVAPLPTRVRLGCLPPVPALARYLVWLDDHFEPARAPQPPASTNWREKAAVPLARMYCNDKLGCCVVSGKAHCLGVWSANDEDSGGVVEAQDAEIEGQYTNVCGPGDRGCVITNVLNYMVRLGFLAGGKRFKLDGYAAVDWTNTLLVQTLQALGGASAIGINLPEAWTREAVWDVTASKIVGGHDVCFTGDTKVPLLDGTERALADLAAGAAGETFWVYSCDSAGNIVPGLARAARKTGSDCELVCVTLDNGERVRCTPSHPFMLRDGSYREARLLSPGDSLMPLYRKLTTQAGMVGYEMLYNPATKKWRVTHRVVAAAARGGRYDRSKVVHHKDRNKRNNVPDNLELMSWDEHTRLHAEDTAVLKRYARSARGRAKSREVMEGNWADPAWREKTVRQLGENGRAACRRRAERGENGFQNWTPEQHRQAKEKTARKLKGRPHSPGLRAKMAASFKRRLENDPEARQRMMERVAKAGAAAGRQQRAGLTEAQRAARRENMKKAQAARLARLAARRAAEAEGPDNHRVVDVEPAGREDVYDLTVETYQNFALSAGVFVHNCPVDYDEQGVYVSSWGRLYLVTWRAFTSSRWVREYYYLLSPLWYGPDEMAPSGFDADQLKRALEVFKRGGVPDFGPPEPGPAPGPSSEKLFDLDFGPMNGRKKGDWFRVQAKADIPAGKCSLVYPAVPDPTAVAVPGAD